MTTRVDRVGEFDVAMWLPEGGRGPGIVLIQEIFGLDDYLRSVAAELAADGYVVAVPDLFWRISPGWSSGHDEAGLTASMAVMSQFDPAKGIEDVAATVEHLRVRTVGGVGLLGFCLGGSLAFELAARSDPDTVLSFYGSTVPDNISLLDKISCPLQFHFGGQDPYIPRDAVRRVEEAVAGHDGVEVHVQEQAGHAFHNHVAPMFHHPEAAKAAWGLAREFLGRTLPIATR